MTINLRYGRFQLSKPAYKLGNIVQDAEILMGITTIKV